MVYCGSLFPALNLLSVVEEQEACFVPVTELWRPERAVCAASGMLQGIFCTTDTASATALAVCVVGGKMLKGKFEQ